MSVIYPRFFAPALLFVAALACMPAARAETADAMPAGTYMLDGRHTSVTFKISHLGFSHFTGRFDRAEGAFVYDPATPDKSILDVTIYPDSVDTNDTELDDILRGENWFDPLHYPQARFRTKQIELTANNTAKITGDFTLHGVTHMLTLDAVLVGAGTIPFSDTQVMGFSATGTFNRSDYGISNLEPLIGDEITLQIESEFDKEM